MGRPGALLISMSHIWYDMGRPRTFFQFAIVQHMYSQQIRMQARAIDQPYRTCIMQQRLKNTATTTQLSRLLSSWYKDGSPSQDMLSLGDAQFAAMNLGFMKALLKLTGRPNKTLIRDAFCAQWPGSGDMAKDWACKVCNVVSTCRQQS